MRRNIQFFCLWHGLQAKTDHRYIEDFTVAADRTHSYADRCEALIALYPQLDEPRRPTG